MLCSDKKDLEFKPQGHDTRLSASWRSSRHYIVWVCYSFLHPAVSPRLKRCLWPVAHNLPTWVFQNLSRRLSGHHWHPRHIFIDLKNPAVQPGSILSRSRNSLPIRCRAPPSMKPCSKPNPGCWRLHHSEAVQYYIVSCIIIFKV